VLGACTNLWRGGEIVKLAATAFFAVCGFFEVGGVFEPAGFETPYESLGLRTMSDGPRW
jgi:hypothetical protein